MRWLGAIPARSEDVIANQCLSEKLAQAASKAEIIEGLRSAVTQAQQRIMTVARAQWERNFTAKDASDAHVSVSIADESQPKGIRGSAFLKLPKSVRVRSARRSLKGYAN